MVPKSKLVAFVPTTDQARARAFYAGVLGLPVLSQDDFALVLGSDEATIRVTNVPDFKPQPFTVLGWEVEDIRQAIRELTAKGAETERFEGMPQDEDGVWNPPGGGAVAWFKDPDGNLLSFSQRP